MASGAKWWTRLSAVVTGMVMAVLIPAHAWAASNGVDALVIEAARARRRGLSAVGLFGLLCCLLVVGGIVLAVLMIMKGRKGRK